jgi:hypothetical protein
VKRGAACVAIALLLALAHPMEARLRAEAPPAPASRRIGVGPLLGSVLTGAFRPLLRTYLWLRTDTLYGQRRFDELHQNIRTLLALYPDNYAAREFLGWNLAFNLKLEAPNRELAWRWAREGLDILVEIDRGRQTLAYWFLVQCGQNPTHPVFPMRYAGDDWANEKWWRARAREWGERTWGESLSRFELGLKALEGRTGFYDAMRRTDLAICLAYDEWVRTGRCAHFAAIERALRDYIQRVTDNPALAQALMAELYLVQWIHARDLEKLSGLELTYRPAAALLGIGALDETLDTQLRMACLELAARAFEKIDKELDPEKILLRDEMEMVVLWMEHLQDPTEDRPPLPFD